MRPHDIGRLSSVGSPAVSPDGSMVAYVLARVDPERNRYRSAVWLVPSDGSRPPWQLTAGDQEDSAPTWSPDGRHLAYTSSRGDAPERRYTVRVLPLASGGETITLITREESIGGLTWSPDGSRLAFRSRVRDHRYAEDDERARPPRRVDRLFPRLDNEGWTIDRPAHLHVVAVDGSGSERQVTFGPWDHGAPAWSPDGTRLALTAARHADADLDVVNDLWVLDVDVALAPPAEPSAQPPGKPPSSGEGPGLRRLTATDGAYDWPSWSPDGSTLAALHIPGRIGFWHTQVTLVDVASGARRTPTTVLDRNCAPYPGARAPVWDGDALYFGVEDGGCVHLYRLRGDTCEPAVTGTRWITGYDARAGVLAFSATSSTEPTEISAVSAGEERQLTTHQSAFRTSCLALPAEKFTVKSGDGCALDAWVVLPPGVPPGERRPVLVNVHGGPHTQYGERWFDEFQLYAAAGFVVVYTNPHGSTGYSQEFARAIMSPLSSEDPGTGWGGIDYDDVLAVLDAALERYPVADPTRVGIMGGSYGGYLTSWAIGHTDRFAAACSERAVNNLLSEEWSSDAAGYFRFELGVGHLEHSEEYLRMSPITYVKDITTPVLILHSESDLRCPTEQADCLWVALRLLGKDVEYYRFPAESHELTRSGSPRHRVQRAEIILEFFRRRLRMEEAQPSAAAQTPVGAPHA